ncbi:hypothetical protein BC835DRAFT_1310750 [Cytidiella melzeri]|nr:hypothetical protein BC835DRAFT_1310750 [Cytidiella melzeri]
MRRHPDLYDTGTEWRGYIADAISWSTSLPNEPVYWPFEYYSLATSPQYFDKASFPIRIAERYINEIETDLREAREVARRLQERGGLPTTIVDTNFEARHLEECSGIYACEEGLYQACICLLELLGAIAWGLAHVDEFSKGLIESTRVVKLCSGPTSSANATNALQLITADNFVDIVEHSCEAHSPLMELTSLNPTATRLLSTTVTDGAELTKTPTLQQQILELENREFHRRDLQFKGNTVFGKYFTNSQPAHVPWNIQHRSVLAQDAVIIISADGKVRMRLWALRYRCSDPAELLLETIARGIPFQLVFPKESATATRAMLDFVPHSPLPPPRAIQVARLDYQDSWELYTDQARELLRHPNAVAYAALRPTQLHPSDSYLTDIVEPEEVCALCGSTRDASTGIIRSWFPTQENLEYSGFFRGEWTDAHEDWLLTRLSCIRDGSVNGTPQTSHQWSQALKRCAACTFGTDYLATHKVLDLKREFSLEFGDDWNGGPVCDLGKGVNYDK